jgi:hypothetical protein
VNTMRKRRPGVALWVTALLSICTLIVGSAVQAQSNGLRVTVVQVDDSAFPQVTVRFTMEDEDGLPATGLTTADLQVKEEEIAIPTSAITLEGDTTQPIGLVLAIDVSVDESSFAQMKAAAQAFVNALGEGDEVAVLAFADEVRTVQGFGTRKEAAQAVDELDTEGSYTVLNEATVRAAELASESTLVRRSAVIITDSPSNFGSALQQTVDQIEQAGVIVHLIGFGSKISADRAEEMKGLARATNGQAFVLPTVLEIDDPLHTLNVLLHQGYKLAYQSDLQADEKPHALSIGVTYLNREAQVETTFVALSGQVDVYVPRLADGQEIGGIIHLSTVATAPAAIASVEYLLDGELLATVAEAPYHYTWDTTAIAPGEHVLSVQVEDTAGNQGLRQISLTVTSPVVATISAEQTRLQPGDNTAIGAEATSIEELDRVEFLVDGKPVETDEEAPYTFSFSSDSYVPGEHTVTARAVDRLGRMDEARISVQVLSPPTPTPLATQVPETTPPLAQAWPIGAIGALVLAVGVLTGLVFSTQRRHRRKRLLLEVHNAGNIQDRYELWTEALRAIKVGFALDGVPLTRREIVVPVPETEQEVSARAEGGGLGQGAKGSGQGAKGLGKVGTSIARALSSIARYLPASIRTPVQRGLGTYHRGQSQVRRVSAASSRLSRAASRVSPKVGPGSSAQQADARPAGQVTPGTNSQGAQVTRTVTLAGYQTPIVEPDERVAMHVLVDPRKQHYRSRDYTLKVFSRSVELDGAPMVIAQRSIQIQGIPLLRRILPFLIIYGFAILGLFVLQWVLTTGL